MLGTTTHGFGAYGDRLTIASTGHCGMTLRGGETSDCEIFFADGTGGTSRYRGGIRYSHNTDHMQFTVNAAEKMRITSSGDLLINSTNNWASGTLGVQFYGLTKNGIAIKSTYNGNGSYYVVISNHAGSTIGGISGSTTSATFNTTSDYRLKENVVGINDGITRVKQLTPKRFNFIADSDTTVDGFLAHEAQTVVPEAVTGSKDQVDNNGNPVYQGIDNSKLVPLLTAALQEAIAKIETLEQRLTDAGL